MWPSKNGSGVDMTTLTEGKVVFAFAKAWNRLVPDGFLDLLAPDARYASQWVFDELVAVRKTDSMLSGVKKTTDFSSAVMMVGCSSSVNSPLTMGIT
jgi:hypothetical protein